MQAYTGPYSLTGHTRPFIAVGSEAGREAERDFLLSIAEAMRKGINISAPAPARMQSQKGTPTRARSQERPSTMTASQSLRNSLRTIGPSIMYSGRAQDDHLIHSTQPSTQSSSSSSSFLPSSQPNAHPYQNDPVKATRLAQAEEEIDNLLNDSISPLRPPRALQLPSPAFPSDFTQQQRQNSVMGASSAGPPVSTHTQNVINMGTATPRGGESTSGQPVQPIKKVDHTMESTSDTHSSSSSRPPPSSSPVSSARLQLATHGHQS